MHAFDPRLAQSRPPHFHWTPAQLADAVPLRLSELLDFTVNAAPPTRSPPRHTHVAAGYLPADALAPRFRIS